jgi:hypothetical protein
MLRETDNLTGGNAKREFKIPAFRDQGRMKVSFRKQWHQKQREKFLFKEAMTRFSLEGQKETVPMYIQIRSKPNEDAVAYKKKRRSIGGNDWRRIAKGRRKRDAGSTKECGAAPAGSTEMTPWQRRLCRRRKKTCSVVKHGARTAARNES